MLWCLNIQNVQLIKFRQTKFELLHDSFKNNFTDLILYFLLCKCPSFSYEGWQTYGKSELFRLKFPLKNISSCLKGLIVLLEGSRLHITNYFPHISRNLLLKKYSSQFSYSFGVFWSLSPLSTKQKQKRKWVINLEAASVDFVFHPIFHWDELF
jgi:hypothetical protein